MAGVCSFSLNFFIVEVADERQWFHDSRKKLYCHVAMYECIIEIKIMSMVFARHNGDIIHGISKM